MLRKVAEERSVPLAQVVGEFVAMCDGYLLSKNPCLKPPAPLTLTDSLE
jgi:hypothetical protein